MAPREKYELSGFFGYVVFTNGHILDGDQLTVYYGAADEFVCGAYFSIDEILGEMGFGPQASGRTESGRRSPLNESG